MKLRLFRARQLLKQTSRSIIEIAVACGFVSTPHFSKCYREHFGIPPREERRGVSGPAGGRDQHSRAMTEFPIFSEKSPEPPVSVTMRLLGEARFEPTYGSVRLTPGV